ncbi:hypothetical protein IW140_005376 [Coemansia sp. RSA 1813]|nr:hypothetical protein LPJ74_004406 [Coemansia sp. RSA 1843]KAJ2092236.1 hypothetical protein IW138_001303 [Coemansia sp. RSA 986]KAJ2565264.1 hypothetical protein IW140_005376 [Coemansia sp. RSA 1813]
MACLISSIGLFWQMQMQAADNSIYDEYLVCGVKDSVASLRGTVANLVRALGILGSFVGFVYIAVEFFKLRRTQEAQGAKVSLVSVVFICTYKLVAVSIMISDSMAWVANSKYKSDVWATNSRNLLIVGSVFGGAFSVYHLLVGLWWRFCRKP